MKKKIAIALVGATMLLSGCTKEPQVIAEVKPVESATYITAGRYYTCGEVITEDGNIWGYFQDIISEKESYNNEPIFALFDDNGTPDNIYDDEILGVVLDRETAIYDALEVALSESFNVERNGNIISVKER